MHVQYFRYDGARLLLDPFLSRRSTVIPVDADERAAALQPTLRVLFNESERGGRKVYEVGAQVRAIGYALAAGGSAADELPEDLRGLAVRSGAGGRPEAFLDIADYVDTWEVDVYRKVVEAVPTAWELGRRFGRLHGMLSMYFGQDGIALEPEDLTDVERIGMYVADTHERGLCTWTLPTVVAECAQGLVMFQDDEALRGFFAEALGLGSCGHASWTTWLDLISQVLSEHLREGHGPVQYQR
ncbi:hypothetical protein [Yinghuangia soli]|uniref:Uncharacterized protein n=1 Tax=Yinghuangia soli TaxID=2908204 RepID=A0AA41QB34_9ACTN|nr:hypothetical protein [Yinghuangia soli]MCF2534036.1 hypothetical protein [Yinghuangia soli]